MNNLTEEQKKDAQERIDKANIEIAEICKKYEVEPVISSVQLSMGDIKYKSVLSPLSQ